MVCDADIAQSVWNGGITVGDDGSVNDSFHTLVLSSNSGETGARITATSDDTEFVLVCSFLRSWVLSAMNVRQVAGEPLDQTVFQYGPFVMTSREEIQQTLIDCNYLAGLSRSGHLLTYPTRSNW
jgi:redox-sensitive bicupin YhaK (pirin superfamily)